MSETTKAADPIDDAPTSAAVEAVESLTYDETVKAISDAQGLVGRLLAHKDALELAYQSGAHWKEAAKSPFKSDEGIKVAWLSGSRLMNLEKSEGPSRSLARTLSVHVNGKTYTHVNDTPEGHWVYREEGR